MNATRPQTTLEDEQTSLPALRTIYGLRASRVLAATIAAMFTTVIVALVVVPWQQNVRGSGRVIALDAYDRMQTIAAPLMGRVGKAWVIEGSQVEEGDPLFEIVDNDPEIRARLEQQRSSRAIALEAAQAKVAVYDEQVIALEEARALALSAGEQQVEVARAKFRSAEHGLEGAMAAAEQARLNLVRQQGLVSEGLASQAELELAERADGEARAKVDQARQALSAARNDVTSKEADFGRIGTEAKAKVDSARAQREAANSEVAAKQEEVVELELRINRQSTQLIRAPRGGTVLRLLVSPGAEVVKSGDPLAILVPEAESRAAELWVDGNHVPLIRPGRPARLQFEGWPAVQFAGWPSVAIGTFGGLVSLVDTADDGTGRFRIVVVPDPDDAPWPEPVNLRQGARAKGFILLDEVSLGYELWRLANGFPPVVGMSSGEGEAKK